MNWFELVGWFDFELTVEEPSGTVIPEPKAALSQTERYLQRRKSSACPLHLEIRRVQLNCGKENIPKLCPLLFGRLSIVSYTQNHRTLQLPVPHMWLCILPACWQVHHVHHHILQSSFCSIQAVLGMVASNLFVSKEKLLINRYFWKIKCFWNSTLNITNFHRVNVMNLYIHVPSIHKLTQNT